MKAARKRNDVLKLVHPGKHVEILRSPITAGEIMERYPRHCVARPDVFENPWIAVHPQSVLRPGEMFFLVPFHTVDSLMKAMTHSKDNLQTTKRCVPPPCPKSLKCIISPRSFARNRQANSLCESTCREAQINVRSLNLPLQRVDEGEISTVIEQRRPCVKSPELRIKPCLKKTDSVGRKIVIKHVGFALTLDIAKELLAKEVASVLRV